MTRLVYGFLFTCSAGLLGPLTHAGDRATATTLASVAPQDITYQKGVAYHQGQVFTGLILKKNQKGIVVQEIECRDGHTIRLAMRSHQGWMFYEVRFKDGLPVERTSWDPEGTLLGTLLYKLGKPWDGVEVEYSASRRWKDHEYRGGVKQRLVYYHPNGNKAHEYRRDPEGSGGLQTFWNPQGTLTSTLSFRNEEPWDGTFQSWIEGKLISEQEYRAGKLGKRTTPLRTPSFTP